MNKNRSIRVAAFCLGLMLAGSLQVHAQKVTFRGWNSVVETSV